MSIADAAGGATAISLTRPAVHRRRHRAELAPFVAVFVLTAALAAVGVLVSRRTALRFDWPS